MPRPALLRAIIAKAVAVDVDDTHDAQRLDLVLLSLVEGPLDLATQMTPQDRRRLCVLPQMRKMGPAVELEHAREKAAIIF